MGVSLQLRSGCAGVSAGGVRREASAERQAGESEDDRVGENANGAPSERVGEWPDQTDQAKRSAEDQAPSHECGISPMRKRRYGEQERQPEEHIPRDDVDRVERRWPLPTEDLGVAREG